MGAHYGPHVLVVEDEPSIADSVLYALETEGFVPTHAASIATARAAIHSRDFDAFVLDVSLPDGSGFDLCRELLRSSPEDRPILFLTARDSEVDRILGLELGRGDYMTKPFSPRELTVRLRNLVAARRPDRNPVSDQTETIRATPEGRLRVNLEEGSASLGGQDLDLSASECRILAALVDARGRVLSRDRLLDAVSGLDGVALDRVIDSHIKNIRRKFRQIDPGIEPIITKRGFGYALASSLVPPAR